MTNQTKPEQQLKADASSVQPAAESEVPDLVETPVPEPLPVDVPEPTIADQPVQSSEPVYAEPGQLLHGGELLPNRYAKEMQASNVKPGDYEIVCKLVFNDDCAATLEHTLKPYDRVAMFKLREGMNQMLIHHGTWTAAFEAFETSGSW
ncbi:hypothetical protein [Arthrobacter cavernae]|uniref:Uncharacterized protein n=1 Tax=Arthrobacter cavernae TaxID=2817681 RepID=A0A939KMX3_9MICC|nr:hypothetical protein [Arthrobacter cavernae]MBO1267075.1 hypothetical protein [Arthrobacter cavernae]